jgi:glucose/arabinose dehydrogenase
VAVSDSVRVCESIGKTVLLAVLIALLCAACSRYTEERGKGGNDMGPISTGQGEKREANADTGGASRRWVEVRTLATNLEVPWSFAFLPDGDALVTERDSGKLLRVSPSGDVREIQTLPEGGSGEGGLLGVAVSPDFEDDRYIYAYYTTEVDNRVVRFRMSETPEPILTGIPVNTFHDGVGSSSGPTGCST